MLSDLEGGTNVCFISLPGKTVCERARPSTSVCPVSPGTIFSPIPILASARAVFRLRVGAFLLDILPSRCINSDSKANSCGCCRSASDDRALFRPGISCTQFLLLAVLAFADHANGTQHFHSARYTFHSQSEFISNGQTPARRAAE